MSGNSWANLGQLCVRCRVTVFPHKQVPLVQGYRFNVHGGGFHHAPSPASAFSATTAQYYAYDGGATTTTTITTNQLSFVAGAYASTNGSQLASNFSHLPRSTSNLNNRTKFAANYSNGAKAVASNCSNARNINNNHLLQNNNHRGGQHYQPNRNSKCFDANTKPEPPLFLSYITNKDHVCSVSKKPLDKHEVIEPVAGEQNGADVNGVHPENELTNGDADVHQEKSATVTPMKPETPTTTAEEMGGGGDATSATDTDTL